MPASNRVMIKKLQSAINTRFNGRLLINRTQWYSDREDRPVTTWVIRKAVWNDTKQRNDNIELFKSTSEIQIVLFLRDYWYELNGWEVPTDNKQWLAAKQKYYDKREGNTDVLYNV